MGKIKKVAFIYLTQESGEYYVTDDPGYSVQRRPQLGLQYLSAILEKRGVRTAILDQTVYPFDKKRLIEMLRDYDIAGFYCSDPQEEKVKNYCRAIKLALKIPILVGGPSAFTNATFLDDGCDIVVHGEGETTIQEIIEYYDGARPLKDVKGISYKADDKAIKNPPQDLIADLDEIPFPNRSKVDINHYYDYFLFGMKRPYVTLIASRGCMYRCSFCVSCGMWGYKYRRRSADNVLAEIDDIVRRYNARYMAFQDDVFGASNDWVEEFCVKLAKRPYRIRWMAILHPFSFRDDTTKMLRLMRAAGCDTLSFGLQSAHPRILKNINRNPAEPEQLKNIIRTADKLGFVTFVNYIFGLPGDTEDTIKETIGYSLSCGSTLSSYYVLSVLKGSEIEGRYRGRSVCELSRDRIRELTVYASKKFYARPANIMRISGCIIRNPKWLFRVGLNISSILSRIGFGKVRKKND